MDLNLLYNILDSPFTILANIILNQLKNIVTRHCTLPHLCCEFLSLFCARRPQTFDISSSYLLPLTKRNLDLTRTNYDTYLKKLKKSLLDYKVHLFSNLLCFIGTKKSNLFSIIPCLLSSLHISRRISSPPKYINKPIYQNSMDIIFYHIKEEAKEIEAWRGL